jgi:hypothetical protein
MCKGPGRQGASIGASSLSPRYGARTPSATFFDGTAPLFGPLKHFSLGRQLTLLVLVTALPLLLSTYLMFQRLAANEREGIRQSLMVSARTLASLIDTWQPSGSKPYNRLVSCLGPG